MNHHQVCIIIRFNILFIILNQVNSLNIPQMRFINKSCFSSIKKQILAIKDDSIYNIPSNILDLTDRKLLHIENHPLGIIKEEIKKCLIHRFKPFDNLSPIVTVENNFNVLNFPQDHISRKPTDSYYINKNQLLRTHTSAHQKQFIQNRIDNYVVFGDVYRRDQIDRYHYPAFHQMEAVGVLGDKSRVSLQETVDDMKGSIEVIVDHLFGNCQKRWVETFFPFTHPSLELQIFYDNKWVEMLGCGVLNDFVMDKAGRGNERAWAAGLGLQRFAMKLFNIPDVRLFWSKDQRFLSQFEKGKITQFKQFSKYPVCYKDISMWINKDYNPNDLYEVIRSVGGDLIENVEQTMTYEDPATKKVSKAYRISFRSLQRTLENNQITKYQMKIREDIEKQLKTVTLR